MPEHAGGKLLARYLRRNVEEIAGDPALSLYGAFLSISYLATALFFTVQKQYLFLTSPAKSVCWPLFPDCYRYHVLTVWQATGLVLLLAVLAAAFATAFLSGRAAAGWWLMLATFVLDGAIISQDFRFRLNEHYMLLWTTLVFLFFPRKRQAVALISVAFYFFAGRIKLNADWLSGWELPAHKLWLIPDAYYPAACAYVVILEMVLVWGLIQPRRWLFWAVFAQFVLFHAMSWSIVGFFYPVLMAGIITIHPLRRLVPPTKVDDIADLFRGRLAKPIYALLGVFAALQFVPLLYPGDAAWTSQGRLLSLHMFEGRSACQVWATEQFRTKSARNVDLLRRDLMVRDVCNPLVYFHGAEELCRNLPAQDPDFIDLDLHMTISKRTSPSWHPLIEVNGFCGKKLAYNAFLPNDWILPVKP